VNLKEHVHGNSLGSANESREYNKLPRRVSERAGVLPAAEAAGLNRRKVEAAIVQPTGLPTADRLVEVYLPLAGTCLFSLVAAMKRPTSSSAFSLHQ
jgi:hypothetical protein